MIHAAPSPTVGDILKAPEELVGQEIKQNEDGSFTWYDGLVIGINSMVIMERKMYVNLICSMIYPRGT